MGLPTGYKFKKVSLAKSLQALEAGKKGRAAKVGLVLKRREDYNSSPNHCLYCDAPILVSLNDLRPRIFKETKDKKFCNQSCGAKHNNKIHPKRKSKGKTCLKCGDGHENRYGRLCSTCRNAPFVSILGFRTKRESIVQNIRTHARFILFRIKPRKCEVCGYDVRVDCCHIKPIKSFSESALLSEINEEKNLIALCPNHHVELDLGILKLEEKQ